MIGLINVQYAVAGGRALRDRGEPARLAHRPVRQQGDRGAAGEDRLPPDAGRVASPTRTLPATSPTHVSVKEAVLPFARFAGADAVLGPEMRSTGEVMGIAADFPTAFGKAQAAAGVSLPEKGTIFISVTDSDKPARDPARHPLPRPRLRGDRHLRHRAGDLGDGRPGPEDQEDRRGLPERRRLHPQRRGGPGHQHPDRLGRPHRRLRDPHRGRPPRDPLRHDDDRRLRRLPRDLRRPRGEAEVHALQELHEPREREPSSR